MRNNSYIRSSLATGCALAVLASASSALAQEDANPSEQEVADENVIVVSGVRASLAEAIDQKRNSTEFIDALVAEDFAEFPDSNISEALQRIPGVTVEIGRSDIGPAFGEGTTINVRGLETDFTRVEINGVTATNPGNARGFSFSVFASDLFSGAEVRKTLTAADNEGGLAGTVRLSTYKPLNYDEPILSLSARGIFNDLDDSFGYEGTILYADQFADDTFGISLGLHYAETQPFATQAGHGFTPLINSIGRNRNLLTPEELAIAESTLIPLDPLVIINDRDQSRLNASATVQAEFSDTFSLTFDALYSEIEYTGSNTRLDFPIEGFPPTLVPSDIVVDGDVFVSGTFPESSQFMRIIDNKLGNQQTFFQATLTADWQPFDSLTVTPTIGYSTAKEDFYRWLQFDLRSEFTDIFYTFENGGVTVEPAIGDPLDAALYTELNRVRNRPRLDQDDEFSLKLDNEWELGGDFLESIEFGVHFAEREKAFRAFDGRAAGFPSSTAITDLDRFLTFAPIEIDGPRVADGVFVVTGADELESLAAPNGFDVPEILGSRYNITEETLAGYFMVNFDDGRLAGNAGVRYVTTDLESVGFQTVGGVLEPATFTNDYGFLLPSLQLKYEVDADLIARFSAYRSLTRPALGDIQPGRRLDTFNGGTGNAGNPELDPFTAINIDFGLEWYFASESLISATFFHKELSGFVERRTELATFTDVATGQPFTIFLSQPFNGESAQITGIEFTAQTPFTSLPGFLSNTGVLFNATFTDASGNFAEGDSRNRALPFVSKYSYNLIGYYDDGTFDARLAYAWRDDYALGFNGNGGLFNTVNARGQLDFSSSYNFSDKFSANLDILNLTNSLHEEEVEFRSELRGRVENTGRRFTVGVNYRF